MLTIEIVHARDPQASRAALLAAIEAATQTPQGRARLALIAALSTVTGWYNPHAPRPADRDSWILGQAAWLHDAYTLSLGPTGRVDLEAKSAATRPPRWAWIMRASWPTPVTPISSERRTTPPDST